MSTQHRIALRRDGIYNSRYLRIEWALASDPADPPAVLAAILDELRPWFPSAACDVFAGYDVHDGRQHHVQRVHLDVLPGVVAQWDGDFSSFYCGSPTPRHNEDPLFEQFSVNYETAAERTRRLGSPLTPTLSLAIDLLSLVDNVNLRDHARVRDHLVRLVATAATEPTTVYALIDVVSTWFAIPNTYPSLRSCEWQQAVPAWCFQFGEDRLKKLPYLPWGLYLSPQFHPDVASLRRDFAAFDGTWLSKDLSGEVDRYTQWAQTLGNGGLILGASHSFADGYVDGMYWPGDLECIQHMKIIHCAAWLTTRLRRDGVL